MSNHRRNADAFAREAENILVLPVTHRVNALGGYGPGGEVIYEQHPVACPTELVFTDDNASLTLMSNGSVDFRVTLADGMEVKVLQGSFDSVEKREINIPSCNAWIGLEADSERLVASLLNPAWNSGLRAHGVRVVKLAQPRPCMWYCASFRLPGGTAFDSALQLGYVRTPAGPALLRRLYIINRGRRGLRAGLWLYCNLHGTQRFVYNKDIWYDAGLPLDARETVVCATVPYSDTVQLKRVSTAAHNAKLVNATCDYTSFVGHSAESALFPRAVLAGGLLPQGAGRRLNRFSAPTIAANQVEIDLARGAWAVVDQGLLYVDNARLAARFRRLSSCREPSYPAVSRAFKQAARGLLRSSPGVRGLLQAAAPAARRASRHPYLRFYSPADEPLSFYASSVWAGIGHLYETCRAHGAKLAQGIELGTRDRGQDMWPMMKQDPGRVRADLVHAFSFMYITTDEDLSRVRRLSLRQKLHGMFPRQYPSRWDDRSQSLDNDNRPYTDSPLWLVNSLCMYLRETGDTTILLEEVGTVRLTDPDDPVVSGIVGAKRKLRLVEVVLEIFACFDRHLRDTPYGMAQVLYGDWCDPVDMFGTSRVGDPSTRGRGRGVHVRLSAHLFLTLTDAADLLATAAVRRRVGKLVSDADVSCLQRLASRLRQAVVRWAWEDGPGKFPAGFLECIHELKKDGSRPDYRRGETGYTLGSMRGRDFDGVKRRQLTGQAWALAMLLVDRPYLRPVDGRDQMVRKLLATTDRLFARPGLGLTMLSTPIPNDQRAVDYVGRMGVVPSGTAENGEYHHCQVFMHYFRLALPGQADKVWRQFRSVLSAARGENIGGPFDMPSNSYAADVRDPHFGKGMYFGLSGSMGWMVEIFSRVAGLDLDLVDEGRPDLRVRPLLPAALGDNLIFERVIHLALPGGGYRTLPLRIDIRRRGAGRLRATEIKVNGRRADRAEVWNLARLRRVQVEITRVYA